MTHNIISEFQIKKLLSVINQTIRVVDVIKVGHLFWHFGCF